MREQCLDLIGSKESTRTRGDIESISMVPRPQKLELFTKRASGGLGKVSEKNTRPVHVQLTKPKILKTCRRKLILRTFIAVLLP